MTIMESGTVQPLVAAMASDKKPGSETGVTIRIKPANTETMQG